jgi:hypothetical protein
MADGEAGGFSLAFCFFEEMLEGLAKGVICFLRHAKDGSLDEGSAETAKWPFFGPSGAFAVIPKGVQSSTEVFWQELLGDVNILRENDL